MFPQRLLEFFYSPMNLLKATFKTILHCSSPADQPAA